MPTQRWPPFPVEILDLPDDAELYERALENFVEYQLTERGVPMDSSYTQEQVEEVGHVLYSLGRGRLDAGDESLQGYVEALRRGATLKPEDMRRGGQWIRAHFARRVDHGKARNEAKTRRCHQREIAGRPRPKRRNYLQDVMREIAAVTSRWEEALRELHQRAELPRDPDNKPHIERVCEVDGVVEWHEPGKIARDLPISKVRAIFYKERAAQKD